MSNRNSTSGNRNGARRAVLKSLVAGGGTLAAGSSLPETWTRPVVETAVLPAHAQTTGETGPSELELLSPFESGEQSFVAFGDTPDAAEPAGYAVDADDHWDTLSDAQILDYFVQPAEAFFEPAKGIYEMFAEISGAAATLCVNGFLFANAFSATLNTTASGNVINGGTAPASGVLDEVTFGTFVLSGVQLNGNLSARMGNLTSNSAISVTLTPGTRGCPGAG